MRLANLLLPLPLLVAFCAKAPPAPKGAEPAEPAGPAEPAEAHLAPATRTATEPTRPARDLARDIDRKPQEVMDFFGIEPGQIVAELMSGRGYYVELLSQRVSSRGKVYAHNSPFVLERFAEKPISERLARPALRNATRLDSKLDDPRLPSDLDAVLIVLFYHDTFWQKVDRARMNAAVFSALKPGGAYGVVDHHAAPGSGQRDVKNLHRVDRKLVEQEILAAGFELEAESDILHHPDDDRTTNVFKMRGKTDRFVLRFRKPQ